MRFVVQLFLFIFISSIFLWYNWTTEVRTYSINDQNCIAIRNLAKKYRKALGELSCKFTGIGYRGGFCISLNQSKVGGNWEWDEPLATTMGELFAGSSVGDLGAGLGHYGRFFQKQGKVRFWEGWDGAENVEEVTQGYVKFLDLSEDQSLDKVYDWVMSLEVGEHIAPTYEDIFIQNLHHHNKKGILLSWALPNQGGHFHVNERPKDYIISKFKKLNYVLDSEITEKLKSVAVLPWFKDTLYFFRKK